MEEHSEHMRRALKSAFVVCAVSSIAACGSVESLGPEWPDLPDGAVTLQFDLQEEVHTAQTSGIADRRRLVIRTRNAWESFWSELTGILVPPPDVPAIDFDQRMLVVATMGLRNTGGYSISIAGIFEGDGAIIVRVLESSPGPTCITTQALTAPATAVSLARSDATVEFQEATNTIDCR